MLSFKLCYIFWLSNYFNEFMFLGFTSKTIIYRQNDPTPHLSHPWQLVAPAHLCSLLSGRFISLVTSMGHRDTALRSIHSQWPIHTQASYAYHNRHGKTKTTIDRVARRLQRKAFAPQVVVQMVQHRRCHTYRYTILLRQTTWLVHIWQMLYRPCMDIRKHTVAAIPRPKVCIRDRST